MIADRTGCIPAQDQEMVELPGKVYGPNCHLEKKAVMNNLRRGHAMPPHFETSERTAWEHDGRSANPLTFYR